MTEIWSEALQRGGVTLDSTQGQVVDFGDPAGERRAALEGEIIVDLSHFGLIEVSGGEAQKFLHGQFTNDVRKVDEGQAQLNAWCTAKGRVLVNFWLFQRSGKYYLMLPADSVERVLKRLRMYVLRADVQLRDAGGELGRMGLSGPRAAELLQEVLGYAPPEAVYACASAENATVLRVPGLYPRYVVVAEPRVLLGLWAGLAAGAKPAGRSAWELLDILAGQPWIGTALAEEFVPQMLNLQVLDGVSFDKGCYPGQEIVARSQYLGSVKRRLYLATRAGDCPAPGETLPASDGGEAGQVVSAQPYPQGGCALLAVVRNEAVEANLLPGLAWLPLPYQAALEAK